MSKVVFRMTSEHLHVLRFLCLFAAFGIQTYGLFNYTTGKMVTLNPRLLEWHQAALECEQINGTLLTITDIATTYDLEIEGRWILWVGLTTNTTTHKWQSGHPVTYTNWDELQHHPDSNSSDEYCVSVVTSSPFWWTRQNCSTRLPSLCETFTGDVCEFKFQRKSSLIGFTKDYFTQIDLPGCQKACINADAFNCESFVYNEMRSLCELFDTNRWVHEGTKFTTNDPEWDYYHMDCYSSDVNESLLGNVWEPTTMPTIQAVTEKICFTPDELRPTENETKEVETAIQELQDLGVKYKDKRRSLTKESAVDDRPSATYLGTMAILFLALPMALIVALDIITGVPKCCEKKKKRIIKISQSQRARARAVLAQRRFILSSSSGLSSATSNMAGTDTDTSSRSSPIEIEDVRIQIRRPVLQATSTSTSNAATLQLNRGATGSSSSSSSSSRSSSNNGERGGGSTTIVKEPVCLNTEIEIRDTVHTTLNTREKDDYSCINAAYVNTSPVLSPFYRSHSEKKSSSGARSGNNNHYNSSTEQRRGHKKNLSEQGPIIVPKYSNFGPVDFTLWPYRSIDRYYKRSTNYGREKFILAYGSSSAFQRDEEVESFRC